VSDLETRVSILEREVNNIKDSMKDIKEKLEEISIKVDTLVGQSSTIQTLVKYVVLPLILILGAVIGLKVSLPPLSP